LGRRKGRIDLPRMLEQRMSKPQRTSLFVGISVGSPPFGFQRLDRLTRAIQELLDVLGLHVRKDIMAVACLHADSLHPFRRTPAISGEARTSSSSRRASRTVRVLKFCIAVAAIAGSEPHLGSTAPVRSIHSTAS